MGTNKNSKNILISHDITSEERRRFERNEEKMWMKNQREWIGLLTRKPERVNKNEKNWSENLNGLTNDRSCIMWCNEYSHFGPNEWVKLNLNLNL